jgi:predicted nucleic acid-binding protein
LPALFREIIIPPAVFREITNDRKNKSAFDEITKAGWLRIVKAKDISLKRKLEENLDEGEAEAIVIAIELNADLIIIDELKGREIAKRFNLNFTGLLGLLLSAKNRGLIKSI